MKQSKQKIGFLAIFLLLAGLTALESYRHFEQKRDAYYARLQDELNTAHGVTAFANQETARAAFNTYINQPEILELYKKANSADEAVRNDVRQQLYKKLLPLYERLQLRGVRQLHFHLPNSESFLRFHRPEKYGDRQFHNRYAFMIQRQLVEDKAFAAEQKNYQPSDLSDDYLYEQSYAADDTLQAINAILRPKIQERLGAGEGFAVEAKAPNAARRVVFFPVKNVKGQQAAYIVSYHDDATIRGYYSEFVGALAASIAGLLVIAALLYLLTNALRRLRAEKVALQQEQNMFVSGSVVVFKWQNREKWPVEYVSANTGDLLGYTASDFLSGKVLYADIVHPEDISRVAEEVKIHSENQIQRFEHKPYRLVRVNNEVIWVLDYTTILRDEAGAITHYLGYLVNITELKKAEEALRANEERLELVLKGAELGLWDWHIPSGKIVRNERWAQMLGYTLDEIEPNIRSWEKLMHPDEFETVMASLIDHQEGRSPIYRTEHRLRAKSGEWKWILDTGKVLERDKDGKPVRMLGIHQDITDRKQAEEALRQSLQMNQSMLKAIPDLMFTIDKNYVFRNYHSSSDKDLYAPPEVFLGKQVDEILPPELAALTKENVDKVLHSGEMSVYEYHIELAGKTRFYDTRMVFQEENLVLTINRDITDRKQAEEQLHNEREKLFVTLRSIGDGVITTDTDGRVTFINSAVEHLTGWSQGEAAGRPLARVFHIINEKTGEPVENPVKKVLDSGTTIGLANHTALIARDGAQRSIADSAAPILDAQGKTIGVVLVFRDVTETKIREEEQLKIKKLESVGILAGGIAHDFNNILTAILGNINLAGIYIEKENEAHRLLKEAEKASLRARDLTRQLLTFSKGGDPVRETASITQVITDSADFVLRGSNVKCRYAIPEDLWLVDIDTGQMSQVIQNITINARQAMPEGGEINISCENIADITTETGLSLPGEKYIKITIADTGCGIPEKYLDKIFDPYFSTKQEGSGLGLAVTHAIINKHDGHILVRSKPGAGATFTIYLPASAEQKSRDVKGEAQQPEPPPRGTILVMDDNAIIQDAVKEVLSYFGHEVLQAKDGAEAIAIFREHQGSDHPIDLIIMDLTIPGGMGGKEAIQEILKIDPEAKVIASSGYSNDPVMANYRQYGFKASIGKPFEMAQLEEIINSVLG